MRKITHRIVSAICFIVICGAVQAQKIYKAQLQQTYSGRITSSESRLQQMVHNEFINRTEVTTIDFTKAITPEAAAFKTSLQKYLKNQDVFSITNAAGLINTIKEQPSALSIVLPYKNKQLTLDLVQSNIFTDDFKAYTDKNPEGIALSISAFYKGVVRGSNAPVSISLFEDHVEGFITLDKKTSIEITRILGDNPTNQHAIYSDEDMLVKGVGHSCEVLNPPASEMEKAPVRSQGAQPAAQLTCVTNYWETAYSVLQRFGKTKSVTDFVTSLFNVYATVYTNESIGMKLSGTFIWTSQDPYGDNLSTFSAQRTGFNANLAMLLSNAPYGGVAWLNTLCQSGDYYRHSYCGSIASYENVLPITSYSWPVMVTSHEVGHNLGSPHTHACAWNGNNTAIDGCGPAAGYSEGCTAALPTGGGTVMSYCHLIYGVGINLTLGFGPQPGNLIRGTVSSCITATCPSVGPGCTPPTGVSASGITANSATIKWKKVAGAAYYYIYLSSDGGSTFTLVATNLYAISYKLTGLLGNHNYVCDVWVACGSGNYASTRINFTTAAPIAGTELQANYFTVQPNPVQGSRFAVSLDKGYENAFVEIINYNNVVIAQSKTGGAVRSFSAPREKGLYYVRITTSEGVTVSKKFLVE